MADKDVVDMLTAWGLENYVNIFKGKSFKINNFVYSLCL